MDILMEAYEKKKLEKRKEKDKKQEQGEEGDKLLAKYLLEKSRKK